MNKKLRMLTSIIAGVSLSALSMTTSAESLTVYNATKSPFTVSFNGYCDSELGVVKNNGAKSVSEKTLVKLCGRYDECLARIFKSKNCSGKQLAHFSLTAEHGIIGSTCVAKNYVITHSHNSVTLAEGL